ncbi:MAG: 30S ribosomal protein S17 [uncultured bacterium]|uniref:Small ribosomal subunit protein uS17 n=1 Tax=Candidatus Uhrbacteria bacterium GW2011_GWC1_41_20 TaxID=1618983 RepID=A0A0G0YG65_9BACT|nr:MAG: 30S ribosomal protein S17 [uncultured bacterium]KKR22740.1 MAG: 30S ribosomal protein S17 [Candidatus Uhrbacteria bacterium GW2011_GWE1_39_46]KKR64093.1 MAG: 30S ribosomal protein S17 [Candidatus Uhrbacteria bacterium GW2011_GWC2_40_450]KKR90018.1 MAG: 30S ribosomal protein S17 [Candidatus Uhrbacteria bacterium GW2011_GWD2_41_121]KKR90651.1 MAG: 30S ribosomal protein S17 [Candidatus Uhrbacteria bacterium GW2011_GWE2_41_1153]KKR95927.1 MAG: 30S ribosomal protein S17 [Candidatus Uhrbacte
MEKKSTNRRQLKGVVSSDKMDKTAVVKVDRTVLHSKYLKRFTKSKKYKVHDPENKAKIGDKVVIEETRPISKDKNWRIIEITK